MKNILRGQYVYLAIALIFFILILLVILVLPKQEQPPEELPVTIAPSSSPDYTPSTIKPILTNELPYNPPSEGGGIDLKSSIVQQSRNELTKLLPYLPYETEFDAPDGGKVSILIPGAQFQTTPWILDAQIFGIDYQINEDETDYNFQRQRFVDAAQKVFQWIKSQGADPEKIIINWGDKAYIRERAEKWLAE